MAQVSFSQHWLDSLTSYVGRMQEGSLEQADEAVRYFHRAVVQKARDTPGWQQLADQIEVWSQDGRLFVGIRNRQFVSEAWLVEYGDRENVPNALFRNLTEQISLTNENAQNSSIARYGTRAMT